MYCYSNLLFSHKGNNFTHNLDADFACFAVWKSARPCLSRIRERLLSDFTILLETEVIWSERNFHNNALRLYETPIFHDYNESNSKSPHADKIGDTKFILFVIKDDKPKYTYARSVSGKIELSNLNVIKTKYVIRDWIEEDAGAKFGVHSTNNIYEFFFQAPLLLGVEIFQKLINGEILNIDRIEKDLEGADGWKSYKEAFEILNLTCNYLVLRGLETLPESNPERDLDILTDNYQRFASAIGAKQVKKKPYKGTIKVNNEITSLDMRFVGDNYYFTSWAQEMLNTKERTNGIYVPRIDHYFFSLFYHAKVQKSKVKEGYYEILDRVSDDLKFEWFSKKVLDDDRKSGIMLRGYLESERYFYEKPLDIGVYENLEVVKHLPKSNVLSWKRPFFKRIQNEIIKRLPRKVKDTLKGILNR